MFLRACAEDGEAPGSAASVPEGMPPEGTPPDDWQLVGGAAATAPAELSRLLLADQPPPALPHMSLRVRNRVSDGILISGRRWGRRQGWL